MKILIVGLGRHSHLEKAWSKALNTIGCNVKTFYYLKDLRGFKGYLKQRFQFFTESINNELIDISTDFLPNVILLFRATLVNKFSIQYLQSKGIKVVFYNPDNCFSKNIRKSLWKFHKEAIPYYDHIFTVRKACLQRYKKEGCKSCSVLKHYYVPWLHFRNEIKPFEERKYDICFIGHCEKDFRLEAINRIYNETNYKILLCGRDWKSFSKKYDYNHLVGDPIYGSNYADSIANSKISLTFFSSWNDDLYTRRIYEVPAAGTLLASPITMTMLSIYSLNECIYFSNEEDIVEKIRPFVENKNTWIEYLNNLRNKVTKEEFSIEGRAKEFINVIESI